MPNRYTNLVGSKKISEDFNNINIGFDRVQEDMDANKKTANDHIANTDIHVTKAQKAEWDNKAPGSTASELAEHVADKVAHLTKAEHDKLTAVIPGAEPNQNAFSKVNSLVARSKTDELTLVGDVGLDITENPLDNSIHFTVTGEAAPGPHGPTHDIGGSDPIPGLAKAITDADSAITKAVEALAAAQTAQETADAAQAKAEAAETPAGAQAKANKALQDAEKYTDDKIATIPPINDASTTKKGIVMLSSSITGTREDVAATEKAVSAAVAAAGPIPYTNKTLINRELSSAVSLPVYTETKINFSKKIKDSLNEYTVNGELQVKKSGIYYVGLYLYFTKKGIANMPKGTEFLVQYSKNNNAIGIALKQYVLYSDSPAVYVYANAVIEVLASDTIFFTAFVTQPDIFIETSSTNLTVFQLT